MKILDKMEALEKGATKGPWYSTPFSVWRDNAVSVVNTTEANDSNYIVELRNHAAALLRVAREAENVVNALRTRDMAFHGPASTEVYYLAKALNALEGES